MTYDDAVTIVGMIANSFPGPVWEEARLSAYVEALLPMDAEVTTKAVVRAVNTLKYRPSIAEIRELARLERALTPREEAELILPDKTKPLWVQRWERARAAGDQRPFPEQQHALDMLARRSPEDYRVYAPPAYPFTDPTFWIQGDEYLDPSEHAIVEA